MLELMILAATAGAQAAIHSYFDPLQRWKLSAPPSDLAVQPLLVYIPGLDGTNASPFAQFPRLAEQFRVRAQEVSTEPSACEASFEALVEDVAAYLREHGSTEHGNVVMGESMGGVVAAGVALQHPELVSGLILVNPATALSVMPDLQSDVRWMRHGSIPEALFPLALFLKVGYKTFDANLFSAAVRDILVDKRMEKLRAEDPELAAYYDLALESLVASISETKPSAFLRGRLAQLEHGCTIVEKQLASLQTPTLVIAGTADALLLSSNEAARLLRTIPICDVHLVEGAGHAGTLNQRIDLPLVVGRWVRKRNLPLTLPAKLTPFGVAKGRPRVQHD